MLAYVLDAWAEHRRTAPRPVAPVVVYSPPVAALTTVFADARRLRPPGRAARYRRRGPRRPGRRPRRRDRDPRPVNGDVPLVTGADLEAILEARRADDAAIALASVYRRRPGPASAGSSAASSGPSSGSSRPRTPRPRSSPATRSTPGSTPSTPRGCAAGSASLEPSAVDRRALPDRPRPARPRGRPDRQRGRRSRTTAGSTGSTTGRSWRPPSGACASGSTRRHMRDGRDDARPLDGLPRLGRGAGARTSPSSRT